MDTPANPQQNTQEKPPENEAPKIPFWKRPAVWIFGVGMIALIAVIAGYLMYESHYYVTTNDATIEARQITVAPDIEGRIKRVHVHEGSKVKAGDLLVELDDSIYLKEKKELLAQKLRAYHAAEGAYQTKERLKEDFERLNAGYEMGVMTQQERDDRYREYQVAIVDYMLALIDIKIAEASLNIVSEKLEHLKIFSPTNGIIAKRWLWEGDMAQVGQAVFILSDLSDLWVNANLEEKKMTNLKLGDPVEIHVDAYPDCKFVGRVFTIKALSASKMSLLPPDNASGNYTKVAQRIPLKISLDPLEGHKTVEKLHLYPGMSVEVKIRIR